MSGSFICSTNACCTSDVGQALFSVGLAGDSGHEVLTSCSAQPRGHTDGGTVWRKALGVEALQTYEREGQGAVGGQGGTGRGQGAQGRAVVLLIHSVYHTAIPTHPTSLAVCTQATSCPGHVWGGRRRADSLPPMDRLPRAGVGWATQQQGQALAPMYCVPSHRWGRHGALPPTLGLRTPVRTPGGHLVRALLTEGMRAEKPAHASCPPQPPRQLRGLDRKIEPRRDHRGLSPWGSASLQSVPRFRA